MFLVVISVVGIREPHHHPNQTPQLVCRFKSCLRHLSNTMHTPIKRVSKGDYMYVLIPDHPNATKNGYVLEHRHVMEEHLGRYLSAKEEIHHKDEDKKNNNIDNLVLCADRAEHAKYHTPGRTMVTLECPVCGVEFTKEKHRTHLSGAPYLSDATCCSRSCGCKRGRLKQLGRL
jgi:hypothetical protein